MQTSMYMHYDNPEFYKQKLPAEFAHSRVWQLVYGEFRAPKYMAVMREYIKNFDWDNVKESDIAMATQLLQVWAHISRNRLREWPVMNARLKQFSDRLIAHDDNLVQLYIRRHDISWIDNETVWYALVEEPYAALQL